METETEVQVNFGKSIIVPSVQELANEPISTIPPRYVRDDQDLSIHSSDSSLPSVPVIDIERLVVEDSSSSELERLHSACKDWGFFQVCLVLFQAKQVPKSWSFPKTKSTTWVCVFILSFQSVFYFCLAELHTKRIYFLFLENPFFQDCQYLIIFRISFGFRQKKYFLFIEIP